MAAAKQVVAKESFATTVGKVDYFIVIGDVLPAGHPVVKAHQRLFESDRPLKRSDGPR
jgi:hypothetical protein